MGKLDRVCKLLKDVPESDCIERHVFSYDESEGVTVNIYGAVVGVTCIAGGGVSVGETATVGVGVSVGEGDPVGELTSVGVRVGEMGVGGGEAVGEAIGVSVGMIKVPTDVGLANTVGIRSSISLGKGWD